MLEQAPGNAPGDVVRAAAATGSAGCGADAHPPGADRRARRAPGADRAAAPRARRGDPPPDAAAGPAPAGALHRARRAARRLRPRATSRRRSSAGAVVKTTIMRLTLHLAAADDYPAYAQLTRQARMRTWRKHVRAPRRGAGHRRAGAMARASRARTRRSASASGATTASTDERVGADHLRPHAAAARSSCRPPGYWDDARRGRASSSTRARCPTPPTPRRSCSPATSRAFGPGEPARRRRLGGRRPARLRRGVGAAGDRRLPRRAGHRAARPPRRAAAAGRRRRCRRACSPTGTSRCSPTPTASGSSRPSCSR